MSNTQFNFKRDVTDRLFDPSLSKSSLLDTAAEQFLSGIHQTNYAKGAAWLTNTLVPRGRELLRVGGNLEPLLVELGAKLIELRPSATPVCMPEDEVSRCFTTFVGAGWNEVEVELVRARLKIGERIEQIDSREVVTTAKTIDRAVLRESSRPVNWTNRDSWSRQFDKASNA